MISRIENTEYIQKKQAVNDAKHRNFPGFLLMLFSLLAITNFPAFLAPSGSEHFPFYLVLAPILLLSRQRLEIGPFLLLLVMVVVVAIVHLLNPATMMESAKTLALLLSPIFAAMIIFPALNLKDLDRVVRVIMLFWFLLSLIALVPGIDMLDVLIKPFFGRRAGFETSSYTGTGIVFPEPSHAGALIAFLISYSIQRKLFKLSTVLLFSFTFLLANQSKTVFMLILIAYIPLVFKMGIRGLVYFAAVLFVSILIILFALRGTGIYSALFLVANQVQSGSVSISDTTGYASGRFMANYTYLSSALDFNIEDVGLGLTKERFFDKSEEMGVDYTELNAVQKRGIDAAPVLPRSFLALCAFAFSSFGFVVTFAYLYVFGGKPTLSPLYLTSVVQLLVVGMPGLVIPFLGLYVSRSITFSDFSNSTITEE